MLYHSVAMLSCRTTTLQDPPTSSASYLRQNLSALKATAIVSGELPNQLSNLPIIPYAISLSLRVAYRELRVSRSPMMQIRARKQLLLNSALLRGLGSVYGSAAVLATMVENTLSQQQTTSDANASNSGSPAERHGSSRRPSTSSPCPPDIQSDNHNNLIGPLDSDPESYVDFANIDLSLFDNMFDLDIFSHFESDRGQT